MALAALVGLGVVAQAPFFGWIADDAGATLAAAGNLAAGHGPVPWPGGPRVEAYDSALWVAVLAVVEAAGGSVELTASVLGSAFAALTVVLVGVWSGHGDRRPLGLRGLIAAGVVALSAALAVAVQSGLGIGLAAALLALGGWRLTVGGDRDLVAPLAFLALGLARPEGVLYALAATAVALASPSAPGGGEASLRLRRWGGGVLVPLAVYHAVRTAFYADPVPPGLVVDPGLLDLAAVVRQSWFAPWLLLLPLGAAGLSGARGRAGLVVAAVLGLLLLPGLPTAVRAGGLRLVLVAVALLPLPWRVGGARSAWVAGSLLAVGGLAGVGGHAAALLLVPASVLLGHGVAEVASALVTTRERRLPALALGVLAGLGLVAGQVSAWRGSWSPPTSRPALERRIAAYASLADVVDAPVPGVRWVADPAPPGLVAYLGAPWAIRPAVRGGPPADFAAPNTRAARSSAFLPAPHQLETPAPPRSVGRDPSPAKLGYESASVALRRRSGVAVRRSLLLGPEVERPPGARVVLFSGATRIGVDWASVPSPHVPPKAAWTLRLDLDSRGSDFRLVAFLHSNGEVVQSWEIPPGYGLVPPSEWGRREVFRGTYRLALPAGLPAGRYGVGLWATDADGEGLSALPGSERGVLLPGVPALARGEVWLPVALQVGGSVASAAAVDLALAHAWAEREVCVEAERAWSRVRDHVSAAPANGWLQAAQSGLVPAMAGCWSGVARGRMRGELIHDRILDLDRARAWAPRADDTALAEHRLSAQAWRRARAAVAAGDPDSARSWYATAARADPAKAWARRWGRVPVRSRSGD